MSEIKWIKISVDLFSDSKIKYIRRSYAEPDKFLLVWLYLLLQAGKCNDNGYVYITPSVPLCSEAIADECEVSESIAKDALEVFRKLSMVEIETDGKIFINNFAKHQTLDKMNIIREQGRKRAMKWRQRQKENKGALLDNDSITDEKDEKPKNNAVDKTRLDKTRLDKNKKYENLAELLYTEHKKIDEGFLKSASLEKTFDRWSNDIRLLVEIDKRNYDDIEKIIKWCQRPGSFWAANILSGSKLRKQFNTLYAQYSSYKKPAKKHSEKWYKKYSVKLDGIES